ncbi:phospholipase A2 inhibitor-like isoform X2 [Portunus trituberculatus]|uniref:phospholipase A2 inhibitor-like isoform X2 n=1 Tax=Portunus trituberculatus TaxID=210409 RepID=UPI001E1D1038|nr:phospholipase A2 inhibitor-like isoform X2 [Portunus trituberculatus]
MPMSHYLRSSYNKFSPCKVFTRLLLVVLCCVAWGGANENKCPPAFLNHCSCGMAYDRYDTQKRMKYTVNCTNSGFTSATMLQSLPSETEVLIFTGNTIPTLPINLFNKTEFFDDLDTIDLSSNHIRFIQGKTFHRVSAVKTLILNHNDLEITDEKERPRLFSNFDELEHLHLTNAFSERINSTDYLLSLEDIFYESRLDSLKTLHLEQNEIWSIGNNTRVFCQLPKLEQLLLTDNRLRDFDFSIDCLHSLRYINLERNMITRFSDDAMRKLDEFTRIKSPKIKIRMQQNIIVCDCRSKHFIEWLNKTDVDIEGWRDFKCIDGYPSSNIGKTLKEVHELQCPSYGMSDNMRAMGSLSHTGYSHGYSSATIGALSFLLVFTTSLLLAVAYFNKQKLKSIFLPYWNFITRKIGYTGLNHDEAPQEVNV